MVVERKESDQRTDEETKGQQRFQPGSVDVRCSNCVLAVYRNSDFHAESVPHLPLPRRTYHRCCVCLSPVSPPNHQLICLGRWSRAKELKRHKKTPKKNFVIFCSRQPWEKRAHFRWSCCFMSDINVFRSGRDNARQP